MTATLANGSQYANDYCFVSQLRDGLIHRAREYMDTAREYRMTLGEGGVPVVVKRPGREIAIVSTPTATNPPAARWVRSNSTSKPMSCRANCYPR